ncbi:MAG: hypothetical protein GC154_14265 [bacterium]|nr:hypothetical protein [bacterium]
MSGKLQLPRSGTVVNRGGRPRVELPPFSLYKKDAAGVRRLSWRRLLVGFVLIAAVVGVSSWYFHEPVLRAIGGALVHDPPPKKCSVIAVLGGGGTFRLEKGAELFEKGYAPLILMLNPRTPPDDAPYGDLIEMEGRLCEAVLQLRKISDRDVAWSTKTLFSTWEEAQYLKDWLTHRGADSALVVAGYFQSSRAQWAMDRVFAGTGIEVIVVAAPAPAYDVTDWWGRIDGVLDVQNEYIKYTYYRLRGLIGQY